MAVAGVRPVVGWWSWCLREEAILLPMRRLEMDLPWRALWLSGHRLAPRLSLVVLGCPCYRRPDFPSSSDGLVLVAGRLKLRPIGQLRLSSLPGVLVVLVGLASVDAIGRSAA